MRYRHSAVNSIGLVFENPLGLQILPDSRRRADVQENSAWVVRIARNSRRVIDTFPAVIEIHDIASILQSRNPVNVAMGLCNGDRELAGMKNSVHAWPDPHTLIFDADVIKASRLKDRDQIIVAMRRN